MIGVNLGKVFNPAYEIGSPNIVIHHSLLFDGTDDLATMAANNFYGLTAGTIELFVKTSYSAAYQKIMHNNAFIDFGIEQDFGGGAQPFVEIDSVGNPGLFGTGIADGNWHHLAVSWDATDIRTFLDGTLKTTTASGGAENSGSQTLTFGKNVSNGHEWMNGNMTEIRFSNNKRYTSSFTKPSAQFANDSHTLVLIHCNEGTGTSASDSSGHGNTLTFDATNPPAWSNSVPF